MFEEFVEHLRSYPLRRFGRLRLNQIGQENVQQLVTILRTNLGRHTVMNIFGTLFSILRTARKWGYVVNDIRQADLAISSAKLGRPGRFFTAEQIIPILARASEP